MAKNKSISSMSPPAASGIRLQLSSGIEWNPLPPHGVSLRSVFDARPVPATPYEAGLLHRFESPARVEDVLRALPFHREESLAFLEECASHHILLEINEAGHSSLPDRVVVLPSLCGMPSLDLDDPPEVTFLGVPIDGGASGMPGTRHGPSSIRESSQGARYEVDPLTLLPTGFTDLASGTELLKGVELADAGDVRAWPGESVSDVLARTTSVVKELRASRENLAVGVLGGDHSITHALLAALPAEPFGVLHLDAHPDLGEPHTDEPLHHGNFLGKSLAELSHLDRVVQVGLRGMTGGRAQVHPKVISIGSESWRQAGTHAAEEALAHFPAGLPLYVTLDIDVLDPAYAPSTGTPVPGGLFPYEIKSLIRKAIQRHPLLGWDVVEVGDSRAPADGTAMLAMDFLLTLADGATFRRHLKHKEKT